MNNTILDCFPNILTEAWYDSWIVVDEWHDGKRKINVEKLSDEKLDDYHGCCLSKGYRAEALKLELEANTRHLKLRNAGPLQYNIGGAISHKLCEYTPVDYGIYDKYHCDSIANRLLDSMGNIKLSTDVFAKVGGGEDALEVAYFMLMVCVITDETEFPKKLFHFFDIRYGYKANELKAQLKRIATHDDYMDEIVKIVNEYTFSK